MRILTKEGWITAPDPDSHRAHLESLQREKRIAAEAKHRDRRERIATACMAGMLANPDVDPWRDKVAVDAIIYADALIAELDKEVQP